MSQSTDTADDSLAPCQRMKMREIIRTRPMEREWDARAYLTGGNDGGGGGGQWWGSWGNNIIELYTAK
jgi:hypothetical protein